MVAEQARAPYGWREQLGSTVRFDGGLAGLEALALAPSAGVVVIVDVLRFATAVSVAVERGCAVAERLGPHPGCGRVGSS